MNRKRKIARLVLGMFVVVNVMLNNAGLGMAANQMKPDKDRHHKPVLEKSIIVKYKDDSKKIKEHIKSKLEKEKMKVTKEVSSKKFELLEFSESEDLTEVINVLEQDSNIEAIQPNYELDLFSIDNEETSEFVIGKDINIENAWQITKGSQEVIVGVPDGDIDINHTELINRLYQNPNEIANDGLDNDSNGYIDDVNGWDFANNDNTLCDDSDEAHGTAVCGIIAAEENNVGVVGVAPNVTLLPLKIANGTKGYVWDAIKAIEYAEKCGATIINCSWGTSKYSPLLEKAIKDSKMCFVCAAGNNGDEGLVYPASYDLPNVISVGAVKDASTLANFSNYGDTVDVVAPGVEVYSTKNGNSYGNISGTSAAAPFVTGMAALIKSCKSEITAKEIVDTIISSANKDEVVKLVNAANAIAGDIVEEDFKEDLKEDLKETDGENLKLQRLIEEEKISDEYKTQMISLVEEGFEVSDIFSCYLFAKSFELNIQDIFNKDKSIGDFSGFSDKDSAAVTEMAEAYNVKISVLAEYIKNSGLTIEEISEKLSKEGGEFNLQEEECDAAFKANRGQYNYKQMNNESVNLNTGNLTVQSTDLSLPGKNGFDLNIVTRYSSSEANLYETFPGNLCWPDTYNERNNLLGSGWSFAFSSVEEVPRYNNEYYLHLADGSSYYVKDGKDENSGEYYISNYNKGQMRFFRLKTSEFSCNEVNAEFVLKYDDGRKEYFSDFGKLIGMVDRFGNTIEFHYERYILSSFEKYDFIKHRNLSGKKLGYRLSMIKDSLDREIMFSYKYYDGNYKEVIIKLEDGSYIEYYLTRIKDHPSQDVVRDESSDNNVEDSIGDFQMVRKQELLGNVTLYYYNYSTDKKNEEDLSPIPYNYSYSCKSARNATPLEVPKSNTNYYNLLTQINYPTYASTFYEYGSDIGYLSADGLISYPVISSRRDVENGDPESLKSCNVKTYRYSNNYTGYRCYDTKGFITKGYNTIEYDGADKNLWVRYSFNDDHQLIKEEHHNSEDRKRSLYKTIDYLYGDSYGCDYSRKTTFTYDEEDSTKYIKAVEDFDYNNTTKKLEKYWDTQAKRNSDDDIDKRDDPSHMTVFTYSKNLPYLLTSKEYMKDENTTIREDYKLASDSQSVEEMTISEKVGSGNFVVKAKKGFKYDKYGNVTQELNYLEDNNWSNYITTNYYYDDNVSSRKGKFNGAYLTKKEVLGVKDADGNLVEDKNGSKTGTICEEYIYNSYGQMTDSIDANGKTTKYTYDKSGRVLTTILPDNQGKSKVWNYDDKLNTVTTVDENGNKIRYDYDGLGNLIYEQVYDTTTSIYKNVHQYSYDSCCRLDWEKDLEGSAYTDYTYFNDGRLNTKKVMDYKNSNTLAYQETYTYDDATSDGYSVVTKVVKGETNSPDIVTKVYTNKFGFVEKSERISSSKPYYQTYKYDYIGNKTKERSALANDLYWPETYGDKYEYDYAGRVVKQYNVKGDYITTLYDALGRVKSVTDIKGNKSSTKYSTIFEYDNLGRLIKEKIPFSISSTGTIYYTVKKHYYDRNGNAICEQISNNKPDSAETFTKTEYRYNSRNLLEMVTTYNKGVAENYTQYFYDNVGNKRRMYTGLSSPLVISALDVVTVGSDANYSITKYDYNNLNLLSKMTDPLEKSESYNYDLAGRLKNKIDRNGNTTAFTYDAMDNITKKEVKDTSNSILGSYTYSYYITGNRARMTGGGTNVTYVYDELGNLTNVIDSLSGTEKVYMYDANNKRKSFILKKESIKQIDTYYSYDMLERLVTVSQGNLVNEGYTTIAEYEYDDNGNRSTLKYPNNNTSYTYNLANKLVTLTNNKSTTVLSKYTYTYYLDGNQESIGSTTYYPAFYVYDDLGRLKSETQGPTSVEYTYDDYNNRKTMRLAVARDINKITTTNYEYDKNNRLITESGTKTYEYKTTNSYDNNGNQLNSVEVQGPSTRTSIYSYDGFNQLTKVTEGSNVYSYTYGGDGLRLTKTVNGVTTAHVWNGDKIVLELNGSTAGEKFKAYGSFSSIDVHCPSWSNNIGNLTLKLYKWNKDYETTVSSTPIASKEFVNYTDNAWLKLDFSSQPYGDYLWQLSGPTEKVGVWKCDGSTHTSVAYFNGEETTGDYVSRIYYMGNPTPSDLYTSSGNSVPVQISGLGGVKAKYIMGINLIAAENGKGARKYYLFNGHGDTVQLTDNTGNVIKSYLYDSFGVEAGIYSSDVNPFRYCGEYFDKETSTIYLRARYYNPYTGRFTSEDSYWGEDADPLSLNLYLYCINDPINRLDPSGNDSYILYGLPHGDEGGFKEQAESEAKRLKGLYGTEVHLIPVETEEQFVNAWNGMGVDENGEISIEGVALLFHSNPHNLLLDYTKSEYITTYSNGKTRGTQNSSDAISIQSLNKKTFKQLNILSCNSGITEISDNLGATFLKNNNIDKVYAWDGSVSYTNIRGYYVPRLAWNQEAFKSWAPDKSFFGIRYDRNPTGQVKYYKDKNGNIKWKSCYTVHGNLYN